MTTFLLGYGLGVVMGAGVVALLVALWWREDRVRSIWEP